MSRYVRVLNNTSDQIIVGHSYMFPGERRTVHRAFYEAALDRGVSSSDLVLLDAETQQQAGETNADSPAAETQQQAGEADAGSPAAETQQQAGETNADDLTRIEGVGPKRAEDLRQAGITSFADLVEADPEQLAAETGFKVDDVVSYQKQAAELI